MQNTYRSIQVYTEIIRAMIGRSPFLSYFTNNIVHYASDLNTFTTTLKCWFFIFVTRFAILKYDKIIFTALKIRILYLFAAVFSWCFQTNIICFNATISLAVVTFLLPFLSYFVCFALEYAGGSLYFGAALVRYWNQF